MLCDIFDLLEGGAATTTCGFKAAGQVERPIGIIGRVGRNERWRLDLS